MYALPQALPFHQRAGAIVWCDCSLDKGESNIDDKKTGILRIILSARLLSGIEL